MIVTAVFKEKEKQFKALSKYVFDIFENSYKTVN